MKMLYVHSFIAMHNTAQGGKPLREWNEKRTHGKKMKTGTLDQGLLGLFLTRTGNNAEL